MRRLLALVGLVFFATLTAVETIAEQTESASHDASSPITAPARVSAINITEGLAAMSAIYQQLAATTQSPAFGYAVAECQPHRPAKPTLAFWFSPLDFLSRIINPTVEFKLFED